MSDMGVTTLSVPNVQGPNTQNKGSYDTKGGGGNRSMGTPAVEGHEAFVRRLYRDIYGRAPDAAGLQYWSAALASGVHTRGSVYNVFLRTPEGLKVLRDRARKAYRDILGREPESDAVLDEWVVRIQNGELGVTQGEINNAFKQSPEYQRGPNNPNTDTPGGGIDDGESTLGGGGGVQPAPEKVYLSTQVELVLKRYGLESLAPGLRSLVESGAVTNDRAILWIYDQTEFKERFPALEMQRKNGFKVMKPEEYLQYEVNTAQLMRAAGFPPGFYDDPSDFTELIGNNISPAELNVHITQAFGRVAAAPPEVRARLAQFFGVQGDAALAAYVLDFEKASTALMAEISAAEIAGIGDIMGTGINQATAEQLAAMGYTGQNSMSQFANVANQGALFDESISETADLTAENEGVNAAFGLDTDDAETLENRRAGRIGALSGGGGLLVTEQGVGGTAGQ